MRNFFVAASFLLLSLGGSTAISLPSTLEFKDLNGKTVDVTAGNKNHRLVSFWATWCESCKKKLKNELPKLALSEDLEVITINTDEEVGRAKSYVKRKKVKLPVYRGPTEYLQQLKLSGVPAWAFYSRTGPGQKWVLKKSAMGFDLNEINKLRSQN